MASSGKAGFDEALYSELKCRAANPWECNLECLDVLTSVRSDKVSWRSKFMCGGSSSSGLTSSNVKPTAALARQASMLDPECMALGSKWRDADLKNLADLKGFASLKNLSRPSVPGKFEKKTLERSELTWNTAKGVSAWLMHIAGIDVGKDETLSLTVDGLVVASVDINLIRKWVGPDAQGVYDWCPNIPVFQRDSSDWGRSTDDQSEDGIVKSLWIVTEVLYAKKFTVTGRSGVFASAKVQVATGVPGVEVNPAITVQTTNDGKMIVKAARNSHLTVGYRVMRLDYNVRDGNLVQTRTHEESHLRGQNASSQSYLDSMKEDIFEVDDESGETVPIPILPLSENELNDLNLNEADSTGLQEGTS